MFRFSPLIFRAVVAASLFAAMRADAQHMADHINPAPDRRAGEGEGPDRCRIFRGPRADCRRLPQLSQGQIHHSGGSSGSYSVVDFNRDASPAAKEFAVKYEAAYASAPDFFAAWAYDAVHVLALAVNNAESLEPQKIREAILNVKGYTGAEGTYNFDRNGDGLHSYNIVRNDNGKIVFEKHIEFND